MAFWKDRKKFMIQEICKKRIRLKTKFLFNLAETFWENSLGSYFKLWLKMKPLRVLKINKHKNWKVGESPYPLCTNIKTKHLVGIEKSVFMALSTADNYGNYFYYGQHNGNFYLVWYGVLSSLIPASSGTLLGNGHKLSGRGGRPFLGWAILFLRAF